MLPSHPRLFYPLPGCSLTPANFGLCNIPRRRKALLQENYDVVTISMTLLNPIISYSEAKIDSKEKTTAAVNK